MAPDSSKARKPTRATDIFAFGCSFTRWPRGEGVLRREPGAADRRDHARRARADRLRLPMTPPALDAWSGLPREGSRRSLAIAARRASELKWIAEGSATTRPVPEPTPRRKRREGRWSCRFLALASVPVRRCSRAAQVPPGATASRRSAARTCSLVDTAGSAVSRWTRFVSWPQDEGEPHLAPPLKAEEATSRGSEDGSTRSGRRTARDRVLRDGKLKRMAPPGIRADDLR